MNRSFIVTTLHFRSPYSQPKEGKLDAMAVKDLIVFSDYRMTAKKLFSQEMREITRSIHNKSDTMVNLKLGVTMSDDSVWAEGNL